MDQSRGRRSPIESIRAEEDEAPLDPLEPLGSLGPCSHGFIGPFGIILESEGPECPIIAYPNIWKEMIFGMFAI